jgi:predicted aspartyl protease
MSVAFNPVQGLVLFPATLSGPSGTHVARLALDTAATETTLSKRVLGLIGCYSANATYPTVRVIMGNGVVAVPQVTVNTLNALGQQHSDFTVQAHTLPPGLPMDGLLGLDFIRRYRLVVDFKTGYLVLE